MEQTKNTLETIAGQAQITGLYRRSSRTAIDPWTGPDGPHHQTTAQDRTTRLHPLDHGTSHLDQATRPTFCPSSLQVCENILFELRFCGTVAARCLRIPSGEIFFACGELETHHFAVDVKR